MKKINDEQKLKRMIRENRIDECFSDPSLQFELYCFEKGEFLNNLLDTNKWVIFTVSGMTRILHVRDDGSLYEISSGYGPAFFGDVEFVQNSPASYLVEALRRTWCIALPVTQYRKQLENDPVFLMFLLKQLSAKLEGSTASAALPRTLEEKVGYYMETQCRNRTLHGVERAAASLSCSKRQLLRILKGMCEKGTAEKTGKGKYRLTAGAG
ncbi:MAG: hypothetical protein K6G61_12360 [Solobacterium sp.]|nr:hypothetical protein [Solobacterium sp.]